MIKSTGTNGSYILGNGTSIAAPHVTGAAALYKILNPSSTPYEIRHALITDGIRSTTVCDGLRHGYFETDSNGVGEPLLYVDDLVKKVKQRYEDSTSQQPETVVSTAAKETANATATAIEQPETVVSTAAKETANATGTANNQTGNPVADALRNIFGGITGNK
jgi:subtilisin family serine protease